MWSAHVWQAICHKIKADPAKRPGEGLTTMLRITVRSVSEGTYYVIEGRLGGAGVDELETCWQAGISNEPYTPVLVDLTKATCIDNRGKQLLTRMHEKGAKLVGTGLMTKCIIHEIETMSCAEDLP
jgi:hypothetical protein